MTGTLRDVTPPEITNGGGGLRRVWSADGAAVAAALLNASGVGLGYAYLRLWRDAAVYWVGVVLWLWLASSTAVWLLIIVAWVAAAVVRAYRAGTRDEQRARREPHPWRPAWPSSSWLRGWS